MFYPAKIIEDKKDGVFVVEFRDIPEALTQGETLDEAKDMAQDALITAMDFYFEDRRAVPKPTDPLSGEYLIELPLSVWSKVLLLNTMLEQNVTQSDLAKRLGKPRQEVNRIIDLNHSTKIDTIADALKALGKKPNLII
ncbi:type II toxin-antitoxin system HicB family antitoxin [Acinetobacter guerrae]|uniref:Type II toxin-antitoxin system HicB family antitoxin n=1 Tax=Acinetobacter guerrae TaxID=1843371 RepID=A0A3A8EH19_9GAMM|nr:type II toxin-antitoxin system HicB family antitoxin [Acinetobacter guerrae]RKG33408.1 type II toxin-antitoxin system HicB family antitoxin [Acinetobacter guerrae]